MPRNTIKIIGFLVFILCALPTFAQNAQKRIALVIGNGNYNNQNFLTTPTNDAEDMANSLREVGFEVFKGVNQTKAQTEVLIEDFGDKLAESKGIGLFYYSGVGFQAYGENFLVPKDASFENDNETVKTSVNLNLLLAKIKDAGNESSLILLDATYNSNFQGFLKARNYQLNNLGFARVSPPSNIFVFQSSESGRIDLSKCGRNGLFVASFLKQLQKPKLEFGDLARNVATEVGRKTKQLQQPFIEGSFAKTFYIVDDDHFLNPAYINSLDNLFNHFKAEIICPCGHREESLSLGKQIIEKFGNDEDNSAIINAVRKRIEVIEKEEPICLRAERYNNSYKSKNWSEFFAISREIIADPKETAAFDVLLTFVTTGWDRAVIDNDNSYNKEVILFAKKAIQMIASGKSSMNGTWGTFAPFERKENALGWMNYIIGYLSFRKENQKSEGISYLYKSMSYKSEVSDDLTIYTVIGETYYDEALRLDAEYITKRAANKDQENNETKRLLGLARATADRTLDAFGRAYKIAAKLNSTTNSDKIKTALKQNLDDMYRFRFNIAPDAKPEGVEIYVEKLIIQPMPDPTTKVEPLPL